LPVVNYSLFYAFEKFIFYFISAYFVMSNYILNFLVSVLANVFVLFGVNLYKYLKEKQSDKKRK